MNIWIDDIRPPQLYGRIGWTWLKSYDESIQFFDSLNKAGLFYEKVDSVSFDHDLCSIDTLSTGQYTDKTGYDIAKWMVDRNLIPNKVFIHSLNQFGSMRIRDLFASKNIPCEIIPASKYY